MMIRSFVSKFSKKFGNATKALHIEIDDFDDKNLDSEKNFYKRGIIRHVRTIEEFSEEDCGNIDFADAIEKIGRLAFAGGPPATRSAGALIPLFGRILHNKEVRCDDKIPILKTLSIITVGNLEHQDRCESLGILNDVMTVLEDSNGIADAAALWACYCLHNMIVGNMTCMETVAKRFDINMTLRQVAHLNWHSFSRNFAADVMTLIGLARPSHAKYHTGQNDFHREKFMHIIDSLKPEIL